MQQEVKRSDSGWSCMYPTSSLNIHFLCTFAELCSAINNTLISSAPTIFKIISLQQF